MERSHRCHELKILLVEDNPDDAHLVCEMLRPDSRISLDHAELLQSALERLAREPYDAVLLDLRLPDASDLEALTAVRRVAPQVPVLVSSGLVDEDLAVRALRSGAQDFLVKRYINGELFIRSIYFAVERHRRDAVQDESTRLPTRLVFEDRLRRGLARARREGESLAVLRVRMNWNPGATVDRDELLSDVASRLRSVLRATDTVVRIEDDDFLVIVPDLRDSGPAATIAEKILAAVEPALRLDDLTGVVSTRVGVALYPQDGETTQILLDKAAQAANHGAPSQQRGYRFHDRNLQLRALELRWLAHELRGGLRRGEFTVDYQPQFDFGTEEICAFEALLRWNHRGGTMPPSLFLPVAAHTGLDRVLDEWVLRRACEQVRLWEDAGHAGARVTVNLSTRQIQAGELPSVLRRTLRETQVDSHRLELEVREQSFMDNQERSLATLEELARIGVGLWIDDFASRELPVRRLSDLPILGVKLDSSLTRHLTRDSEARDLVRGFISLVHGLGRPVAAKGVETASEMEWLRDEKCDRVQGFYLGRPLPPHKLTAPRHPVP